MIDAEEHVRSDDPAPARREGDHRRDRKRQEPAENEEPLATDLVGEHAGTEVREGLRDAERDDEGEDREARLEAELLLADEGQHASLETHHRPDEGVEPNEQRELRGVRAEPEPDRRHAVVSA